MLSCWRTIRFTTPVVDLLNVGGEVLLDTTIMDDRRTAWARNGDIRVETR